MTSHIFQIRPIGIVRSVLKNIHECPRQESEAAPGAWIEIEPQYAEAMDGLEVGDEIMVFTWMHLGDRSILKVHPRGNRENPIKGVFATRSPHRPNPIGLHKNAHHRCRATIQDQSEVPGGDRQYPCRGHQVCRL